MARRSSRTTSAKATGHKAEPVEVRNIAHPRLWGLAMQLAGGDAKRITVESYVKLSVLVREQA